MQLLRSSLGSASTIAFLLLGFLSTTRAAAAVSAHALVGRQFVVNDWVSIGSGGQPTTVTATVTTKSGALATISAPPYLLTGSVFTVTRDGQVSTSTGSPPPPTATETNGAGGSFAVCHNNEGNDSPFCQPRRASELSLGKVYYGMY